MVSAFLLLFGPDQVFRRKFSHAGFEEIFERVK